MKGAKEHFEEMREEEAMKTINATLKVPVLNVNRLEDALRAQFEVIDYKILPNTEKLYSEDNHFKKLVKAVKTAQTIRDKYINEKNYK